MRVCLTCARVGLPLRLLRVRAAHHLHRLHLRVQTASTVAFVKGFLNERSRERRFLAEATALCRLRRLPSALALGWKDVDGMAAEGVRLHTARLLAMDPTTGLIVTEAIRPAPFMDNAASPERIAQYLLGAMRGLAALHACSVIHGDIQPGNIVWDEVRQATVVVDYDICYYERAPFISDFHNLLESVHAGTLVDVAWGGTPVFVAPEVGIRGYGGWGANADVYGLGVIAAILLLRVSYPWQYLLNLQEQELDPASLVRASSSWEDCKARAVRSLTRSSDGKVWCAPVEATGAQSEALLHSLFGLTKKMVARWQHPNGRPLLTEAHATLVAAMQAADAAPATAAAVAPASTSASASAPGKPKAAKEPTKEQVTPAATATAAAATAAGTTAAAATAAGATAAAAAAAGAKVKDALSVQGASDGARGARDSGLDVSASESKK